MNYVYPRVGEWVTQRGLCTNIRFKPYQFGNPFIGTLMRVIHFRTRLFACTRIDITSNPQLLSENNQWVSGTDKFSCDNIIWKCFEISVVFISTSIWSNDITEGMIAVQLCSGTTWLFSTEFIYITGGGGGGIFARIAFCRKTLVHKIQVSFPTYQICYNHWEPVVNSNYFEGCFNDKMNKIKQK